MPIETLQHLIEQQLNLPAPLPGSVKKQYTTCGQPNCRCKDKVNPQKHGPYNQLSFSLKGKSSTMFVKTPDFDNVTTMTGSYKNHRELTIEIAQQMIELCRQKGIRQAQHTYDELYNNAIRKRAGERSETGRMKELRASRNKWKARAVKRGELLKKNIAAINNLKNKRDRWYKEVLLYRKQENEKIDYIEEIVKKIQATGKTSTKMSPNSNYQKVNIST
ncbi:MAG: hypothetical protein L3J71_12020 [Victivallaceae bacterium]|nr:hypothetical protein [Victivallaceae bacterium]